MTPLTRENFLEELMVTMQPETDAAHYGQAIAKIRDHDAALRAELAQVTAERDAFIQGGVTEELLRKHDGYIKVGRGCALVLEDEYKALLEGTP